MSSKVKPIALYQTPDKGYRLITRGAFFVVQCRKLNAGKWSVWKDNGMQPTIDQLEGLHRFFYATANDASFRRDESESIITTRISVNRNSSEVWQ